MGFGVCFENLGSGIWGLFRKFGIRNFGFVSKIWDLGFGINLHKMRDLGSRYPRVSTPGLGIVNEFYSRTNQSCHFEVFFVPQSGANVNHWHFLPIQPPSTLVETGLLKVETILFLLQSLNRSISLL